VRKAWTQKEIDGERIKELEARVKELEEALAELKMEAEHNASTFSIGLNKKLEKARLVLQATGGAE
jgi:ribosomal protein L29